MKTIHLLGLLLLIGILVLAYVKIMGEGFSTDQKDHNKFSKKYQEKYNLVGNALVATNNEKALGQETGGLFGNVQDTIDSNGNLVQKIDNPYPLEGGRSGMFAIIDKCEARNTVDCSAFDDPKFTQDCGMCLDIGSNSQGTPQTGGLVLTSKDKTYAQSQKQGNFLPPYSPTVGMCPKGKMVATKAECLKLKAELDCQKSGAFDKPAGCAQCYNDGDYHVINSDLVEGYGTLMVVGSGTLSWSESGQSNTGSIELSTTAKPIPILGGENNPLTLTLAAPVVATPYDSSKTYEVNDHIIFNNGIFTMQEGAGAPGYNPSRPGDKLWKLKGSYANYRVPPSAYLAGYLKPSNGTSSPMDLYRLILTDTVTGRKPRTSGQSKVDEIDVTNMVPGYGYTTMAVTARSPFTYVDALSEEASLCPNSPFITNADSATLLGSDPCYAKGSGPGKYSLECIQNIFQNNGCGLNPTTISKSGYPSNKAKSNLLQFNNNGRPLEINQIADIIYSNAVMTATGVDSNGNQLSLEEWSVASLFCSGVAINSPCQALDQNGKLSTQCIVYLWDNQGANKIPGPTYNLSSLAKSLFSTGTTDRFCTRSGTLAPKDLNNRENAAALAYWKGLGSEAAVKAAMSKLHMDANNKMIKEDDRADIIKQCYGIGISSGSTIFSNASPFVSDSGINPRSTQSQNPVSDVTGIVAWFDAADPFNTGENLVNGKNVNIWVNKFSDKYHAVSKGSTNPILINDLNSLPGINISPGNYFRSPIPPDTFISALNVFIVYKTTGSASDPGQIVTRGLSSMPNLSNPLDMANNPAAAYAVNEMYIGEKNSVFYQSGTNYNFNNATPSIFNLNINQSSQATSNLTMFSNGSQITLNLSRGGPSTWTPSDLGDMLCFGGRIDYGAVNGVFYEMLVYNTTLSNVQRKKVEGYLATKWGLQSSLPVGHPYKTNAYVMPEFSRPVRSGVGWSM